MTEWLHNFGVETQAVDDDAKSEEILRASGPRRVTTGSSEPETSSPLAVALRHVTILDTGKWFGGAKVRLDALVVHGNSEEGATFYSPRTFTFDRVADGDRLPIDESVGMLLFAGHPRHFLDIFLTASRVTDDEPSLEELLIQRGGDLTSATTSLAALASEGTAAVISGALTAAFTLGDVALSLVRSVSSNTIGLYRASFLEHSHNFGIGRHPAFGSHTGQDLEFAYDIVLDAPPRPG